MQFVYQLVPELPASQPPSQASTSQEVQGATPQRHMDRAGQFLVTYNPAQHHSNTGFSQNVPGSITSQQIPTPCNYWYHEPPYQVPVYQELPAATNSFPDSRKIPYYPNITFVQEPYHPGARNIATMATTGQFVYPELTHIYPVHSAPYQYTNEHVQLQPPLCFQQAAPIIHLAHPGGFTWASVVPQTTEQKQLPRARQWECPSDINAGGVPQQHQTVIHSTSVTEHKQLHKARKCAGPSDMNAVGVPQQPLTLINGTSNPEHKQLYRARQCEGHTDMNTVGVPQQPLTLIHATSTTDKNQLLRARQLAGHSYMNAVAVPQQPMTLIHPASITENKQYPRARQWAGPSDMNALAVIQQPPSMIHSTSTIVTSAECRMEQSTPPVTDHFLPLDCVQKVTKSFMEKTSLIPQAIEHHRARQQAGPSFLNALDAPQIPLTMIHNSSATEHKQLPSATQCAGPSGMNDVGVTQQPLTMINARSTTEQQEQIRKWADVSDMNALGVYQQQQTIVCSPSITEHNPLKGDRQWADLSDMNATVVPQKTLDLAHSTSAAVASTEYRMGQNLHPVTGYVMPTEWIQNVTNFSVDNIKDIDVSTVCPPPHMVQIVNGPNSSHLHQTLTVNDTTNFFTWESVQTQMVPKDYTTCVENVSNGDYTAVSWDPLEQVQNLVPSVISTNRHMTSSEHPKQDHAQWKLRHRHFGPESLPKNMTSCEYEDPDVSSIVSSMDYFYNVSTYGVLTTKEETDMQALLSNTTPCPTVKESTKGSTHNNKRRFPQLGPHNQKFRKCDLPRI